MLSSSINDDEDETGDLNPLDSGAAAPPPVIGGGCLARYDPQALNDESGVDFGSEPDAD